MKSIAFALALSALLLPAPPAGAKTISRHFQKSFDVSRGDALELRHGDGRVVVTPWNQNRIDVTVDYEARVTGVLAVTPDFDVEFDQRDGVVYVAGKSTATAGLVVNHSRRKYQYTIQAPAWLKIRTDGDDGDVIIDGWRAELDIKIDDGDVKLTDVEAPRVSIDAQDGALVLESVRAVLDVSLDDGDIRVSDSKVGSAVIQMADGDCGIESSDGDFRIHMDDGNAVLTDVRARSLDIKGEDGSVRVTLLPVENPDFSVIMDDGRVNLAVPRDLSAAFTLDADDGTVDVKLIGATDVRKGRRSVSGTLHGGRGRIHLQTNDGSVTLRQRD